jgi:hypothetical protein
VRDLRGRAPQMDAIVRYLLDKGATSGTDLKAFLTAWAYNRQDLVRLLFDRGVCKPIIQSFWCASGRWLLARRCLGLKARPGGAESRMSTLTGSSRSPERTSSLWEAAANDIGEQAGYHQEQPQGKFAAAHSGEGPTRTGPSGARLPPLSSKRQPARCRHKDHCYHLSKGICQFFHTEVRRSVCHQTGRSIDEYLD